MALGILLKPLERDFRTAPFGLLAKWEAIEPNVASGVKDLAHYCKTHSRLPLLCPDAARMGSALTRNPRALSFCWGRARQMLAGFFVNCCTGCSGALSYINARDMDRSGTPPSPRRGYWPPRLRTVRRRGPLGGFIGREMNPLGTEAHPPPSDRVSLRLALRKEMRQRGRVTERGRATEHAR